jgi:histidine triad (HIT) family protein
VTACTFCRIANGELPAHKIFEDARALAFLDRAPVFVGHTLVVPRAHVETLTDLPAEELGHFFGEVQRVASAVERALEAEGTFVAINNRVSQSVPHLHVHVVPRRRKDGLRGFFWPRTKYEGEEHLARTAASIRDAFEAR